MRQSMRGAGRRRRQRFCGGRRRSEGAGRADSQGNRGNCRADRRYPRRDKRGGRRGPRGFFLDQPGERGRCRDRRGHRGADRDDTGNRAERTIGDDCHAGGYKRDAGCLRGIGNRRSGQRGREAECADEVGKTAGVLRSELAMFLEAMAGSDEDDRRRYERIAGNGTTALLLRALERGECATGRQRCCCVAATHRQVPSAAKCRPLAEREQHGRTPMVRRDGG